jgi:hypothetical protein
MRYCRSYEIIISVLFLLTLASAAPGFTLVWAISCLQYLLSDGILQEEFEDTKGVIKIRKSKKDRQRYGQVKTDKTYFSPSSKFELTTLVVIGTDCIGSCTSNYHMITVTTAP